MKPGEYGLIWINDASYVWAEKPEPDPTWESEHDADGNLIDAEDVKDYDGAAYEEWAKKVLKFEECLVSDPWEGYKLVRACKEAGYLEADGRLSYWLFNKMGEFLLAKEATPEWRTKVAVPGYELDEHDKWIVRILHRKHNDQTPKS